MKNLHKWIVLMFLFNQLVGGFIAQQPVSVPEGTRWFGYSSLDTSPLNQCVAINRELDGSISVLGTFRPANGPVKKGFIASEVVCSEFFPVVLYWKIKYVEVKS